MRILRFEAPSPTHTLTWHVECDFGFFFVSLSLDWGHGCPGETEYPAGGRNHSMRTKVPVGGRR